MPKHRHSPALLLLAAALSACGDSTAPTTGTIELDVVTTGSDLDPNGFVLTLDATSTSVLPANGVTRVTTGGGDHALEIGGLAFNCDATAAPTSVNVTLGQTTRVEVRVSCSPYLRNTIVYTSDEWGFGEVMVMRPDGSRRQRLTTDQAVYTYPVVSPDGQAIAVASWVGGSWNGIYLLDRFGQGRTKLVGRSTFDGSPAWSPSGTTLAFRSHLTGPHGEYGRIFVVNRDGTGLRQLTPDNLPLYSYDDGPSWSPDGTRVMFGRDGVLTVINADGTGLTSLGVNGMYPAWSPDGTRIAYHWWAGSVTAIFVADADGGNPRQLTTPTEGDQMARWSPDGQHLVFQRVEGGKFRLHRIAADGTGETKLTTTPPSESAASWSPSF